MQTAEVPQRFIKFLRTFQDMVNMLFCDPQHGNLLAFEALPAANGFGNEYKIIYQLPMPTNFSGEQVPDLDELLKAAIGDIKPMAAFTGNLAAPLAATGPAPGGFQAPAPASIAPAGFGAAAPSRRLLRRLMPSALAPPRTTRPSPARSSRPRLPPRSAASRPRLRRLPPSRRPFRHPRPISSCCRARGSPGGEPGDYRLRR